MNFLTKILAKPPAEQIAGAQQREYERLLLTHQESAAYHQKMAEYYAEGITRLGGFNPKAKSAVQVLSEFRLS